MAQNITIQIFLILLCLAEVPHDKAQILDSKNDYLQQKRWHLWSGIYYCMVAIFFGYLIGMPYFNIVILLQSFCIRLIFFGNILNVARKGWKEFFYLSDKGIDGIIKKYIGGIGLFISCLSFLIISNLPKFYTLLNHLLTTLKLNYQ